MQSRKTLIVTALIAIAAAGSIAFTPAPENRVVEAVTGADQFTAVMSGAQQVPPPQPGGQRSLASTQRALGSVLGSSQHASATSSLLTFTVHLREAMVRWWLVSLVGRQPVDR